MAQRPDWIDGPVDVLLTALDELGLAAHINGYVNDTRISNKSIISAA
jgi:hypothetical protein